jgi:ATP-dependent protease Clp ATPase subunit
MTLRCSFCGKSEHEVAKLVAGAKAYICDECIAIAERIVKSSPGDPDRPRAKRPWWRIFTTPSKEER